MTEVDVRPVTPDRWDDLVALFGWDRGGYSGCWCMWWRQTSKEFDANHHAPNRDAMGAIVAEGRVPGLLAYVEGEPVGWVSLAPRDEFGRLQRSPVLGPVDEEPVWSIVCFYIHRRYRRTGVGTALLQGAIAHAAGRGARVLEAYPVDAANKTSAELFTGTPSMFERAGFREAERRRPARPILRLRLD